MADAKQWFAQAAANAHLVAEVPQSHRSVVGRVVTVSKRLFVAAVDTGFLQPQRRFNQHLVERLRPVVQRGDWTSGTGPAPDETAIDGWFAFAIERQREWNKAVLELIDVASGGGALPALHSALGRALALGKIPMGEELSGLAKGTYPLWFELFRKQQVFNEAIVRTVGALKGLPRAPDLGTVSDPPPIAVLQDGPLISVVTPVFRTPEAVLTACVDSVLAQTYSRWELCLVDDGSAQPALASLFEAFARKDPRIRVEHQVKNEGIARATNRALAMATGELVAFLDHDDTLDPQALAYAAAEFRAVPETDFLYSDEDKLDAAEKRGFPFFKPDWSPELLRSCNYACHFLVARRGLVDGLRDGFDGAQDYDLVLRMSERARRVGHIPHVLYHWRSGPQSTALDVANKPMATAAGVRALTAHLARTGQGGEVVSPVPTNYRVRCAPASVSVVTATTWQATTAKVCVFVGPGVSLPDADSMSELAGQAMRPEIGLVCPKVLYPDQTICFPTPFEHLEDNAQWTAKGLADWTRDVDSVSEHCFAIRTELLQRLGGTDQLALRIRALGLRVVFTPYARAAFQGNGLYRVIENA